MSLSTLKNELTLKIYMLCGTTGCLNPTDLTIAWREN